MKSGTRKPTGQQITVHGLRILSPFTFPPSAPSRRCPSPRSTWLAREVNNHQKSQCLSRAAALCAPTRAPDANMTPARLYYELLELLHRRRIFTCSQPAIGCTSAFLYPTGSRGFPPPFFLSQLRNYRNQDWRMVCSPASDR